VRIIKAELSKVAANNARGGGMTAPTTGALWLDVVDPDDKATAPEGGGAGYISTGAGNAQGAVGVVQAGGGRIVITRPAYLGEIALATTGIDPTQI